MTESIDDAAVNRQALDCGALIASNEGRTRNQIVTRRTRGLTPPRSERQGGEGLTLKSGLVSVARFQPKSRPGFVVPARDLCRQSLPNPNWLANWQDSRDPWSFGDRTNRREPPQTPHRSTVRLSPQQVLPVRIGSVPRLPRPTKRLRLTTSLRHRVCIPTGPCEGDGMSPGMRATTVRLAGSDVFVADEPSPRGVCLS